MKTCPKCKTTFDLDGRYCPRDGERLIRTQDDYIGKVFMEQFEIRELTGRGSMGTVYKAWQSGVGRDVAVKVLNRALRQEPQLVERFNREARAAAQLTHPNIIIVYLVGETHDGVPLLAMEFVDGRSLADVCEEEGPFPPERTIAITRQIAGALAEAHRHGIVHRDLKAENILLCDRPDARDFVKVVDFGIAKILTGVDDGHLTATGAVFGTPHYLSPEQASGKMVDHRSDIYALGVILFYMCTGRLPFEGETGMGLLVQHIKEPPPSPQSLNPSVPHALEEMILRCMEKDPADRYQSADEVQKALKTVEEQLLSSSVPTLPRFDGSEVRKRARSDSARRRQVSSTSPDRQVEVLAPGGEPAAVAATVAGADPAPGTPVPPPGTPTTQESSPAPAHVVATTGGMSTQRLAGRIMGRRRFVLHAMGGVAALLGGAGVGYAAYYRKTLYEGFAPPPDPEPRPALEPKPDPVPEPEPDPKPEPKPEPKPAPKKTKKVTKKTKRKPKTRTKPKPTPPKPKPEPEPGPEPEPPAPDPEPKPAPKPAPKPEPPKPAPLKPAGPDPMPALESDHGDLDE